MRTTYYTLLVAFILTINLATAQKTGGHGSIFYDAKNPLIHYVGRIDFSNPLLPRFWAPGVYIKAKFRGTSCEVLLTDESQTDQYHNYVTIVIDKGAPRRVKLNVAKNVIKAADSLNDGPHTILICKATESAVGYLEFVGVRCKQLLPLTGEPKRRIEFIGNSITCGLGADLTIPCGQGQWYEQNNAYLAYGPLTARALHADWQLTSVSGIGMSRSCCGQPMVMPMIFDKINFRDNAIQWNFKYQPDIVTICLGQNDGIIDSTVFCSAYVQFLKRLRGYYPKASFVCLTSPMADGLLVAQQKRYLSGIVAAMAGSGDTAVSKFYFSRSFTSGCGRHPDLAQHQQIAAELIAYLKKLKNWN